MKKTRKGIVSCELFMIQEITSIRQVLDNEQEKKYLLFV